MARSDRPWIAERPAGVPGCFGVDAMGGFTRNTRNYPVTAGLSDVVSGAMARERFASADRQCPVCGRRALMDVRATYCSSACKQAAYRRRLQQSETSRQGSLCKVTRYVVSGLWQRGVALLPYSAHREGGSATEARLGV